MSQVLFEDGQFYRDDKLLIGANSRAIRYGDGLFETMKVNKGSIQLADWHFERLFSGLALLQFECPSYFTPAYLKDKILQLAHRNGHSNLARIRLMIFRGNGGLYDTVSHFPHHVIQCWSLPPANHQWNENGLVLGIHRTAHKTMDLLANTKSNNYLPYVLGALEVKKEKWNDAVVLNAVGRVADCTIANLFLVKEGVLYTPAASEGPVLGIMRRYMLDYCRKAGLPFKETTINEEDLQQADEIFLTNTSYGIRWVGSLGDRKYANSFSARLYKEAIQPLFHPKN
ncbi:aminotransferase class IV [Flavihumibacter sp. RY-1]|uniref:branched-chain-amino-acid transaminase n=1 Tax=Flavihumibacter fluminis TaxID=2909236 RepID=A0ABS9BF81_9BACT|nr:aminotransferase class IV [Flavihumibacter fluminis]MCF1713940.1 aminotransferase class IV [Flavihumibacter fluminis]